MLLSLSNLFAILRFYLFLQNGSYACFVFHTLLIINCFFKLSQNPARLELVS